MTKTKRKEPPAPREASSRAHVPAAKLLDPNNVDTNKVPQSLLTKTKQKVTQMLDSSESEEEPSEIVMPPKKIAKITIEKSTESSSKDEEGFLNDLSGLEEINDPDKEKKNKPKATQDIEAFFSKPFIKEDVGKRRLCTICRVDITYEATTCRRHLEAHHVGFYLDWIKRTPGAVNRLPKYRAEKAATLAQSTLPSHFPKTESKEKPMPYSDSLFKQVALEWLAESNQPIQAFESRKFKEMIDVASRAKEGVKIPAQKATRTELIRMFRDYLLDIKERVKSAGKVSFTCDAWQAGNTDAYFAVTAHWIEETGPLQWELKAALIGFTQMNQSHTGERLGQALFKLIKRVGLVPKTGWITSDNASNNMTMMREFARCYEKEMGVQFLWEQRWIRCLAHVINLSTQAILKSFSTASFAEDVGANDELTTNRDEVGMIRTIVVKIRSSSQRKEKFLRIQREHGVGQPRMIPPDMKVRWSSTFVMIHLAYVLRQSLELFMSELAAEERDPAKKRRLQDLNLSIGEWANVKEFQSVLKCADNAQQAFSSETFPALHLAIPALEALHAAWKKKLQRISSRLIPAVEAGMAKVDQYYQKTETSDAYLMAIVLDPETKMAHFKKHWDALLYQDVQERIENIFSERFMAMYGSDGPAKKAKLKAKSKISSLLMVLDESDEDEDVMSDNEKEPRNSPETTKPWLKEFVDYLEHQETIVDNLGIVVWWGRHSERYPVWASLARDYLSIMASSVSSERAFSGGGITITKRRNRLKGDIVEALQVLKCALRTDLLIRPEMPSTAFEEELVFEDKLETELGQEVIEGLQTETGTDNERERFLKVMLDNIMNDEYQD